MSLKWLCRSMESLEDEEQSGYMAPVVKRIGRRYAIYLRSVLYRVDFLKGILHLESFTSSFFELHYTTLSHGCMEYLILISQSLDSDQIFANINETLNN